MRDKSGRLGFTLVELIVVIGIICVLAGVLFASLGGSTESAKAARCLSNMRNLAAACQAYGAENHKYPHAGSIEWWAIDESRGISNARKAHCEEPGWISWDSRGKYPSRSPGKNSPSSPQASSAWMISMYSDNTEAIRHCLTNGVLWRYVSGNAQTYVCPVHANKMKKTPPHWSYLMNAYFGWYKSDKPESEHFSRVEYGRMAHADKVLLFSEVPFAGLAGSWNPTGTGPGMDCDCVLQFKVSVDTKTGSRGCAVGGKGEEVIGFNHKAGKTTFANVVFADGHTEKLRLPKGGMSDGALCNLTAWLCTGTDVSFDGRNYQKVDN